MALPLEGEIVSAVQIFLPLAELQGQLFWQPCRYRRRLEGIIDPCPQITIDKQLLSQQRHEIG
jgi:hypothetical protein